MGLQKDMDDDVEAEGLVVLACLLAAAGLVIWAAVRHQVNRANDRAETALILQQGEHLVRQMRVYNSRKYDAVINEAWRVLDPSHQTLIRESLPFKLDPMEMESPRL